MIYLLQVLPLGKEIFLRFIDISKIFSYSDFVGIRKSSTLERFFKNSRLEFYFKRPNPFIFL